MKKTRRKMMISLVCILMTLVTLLGSTYAWFTDSVSNTGNRIQAGTLKVDLLKYDTKEGSDNYGKYVSIANQSGDIFYNPETDVPIALNSNKTLWEPGKTQFVYLAVKNDGNLALKYNIYVDATDEGLIGSLEYAIIDKVEATDNTYGYNSLSGLDWSTIETNAQTGYLAAGRTKAAENGALEVGGTDYFVLAVHMDENAGNEYQGKDVVIDVTVTATQMTAEKDAFNDDTYDEDASVIIPSEPIHAQVMSSAFNASTSGAESVSFTSTDTIKSATLSLDAAKELIPSVGTTVAGKQIEESESVDVELQLNVDTVENNGNSIVYEINLSQITTVKSSTGDERSEESEVDAVLDDWLTAGIDIGKGLGNVVVTHDNNTMSALNSADDTPTLAAGGYYYDSLTGILTIKAKSFSPFEVNFGTVSYGVSTANNYKIPSGATILTPSDISEGYTIEKGTSVIYLGEGTFNLNKFDTSKVSDISFVGAGFDKTNIYYGNLPLGSGESGSNYSFQNKSVHFYDATLGNSDNRNEDDVDYKGFVRASGTYFTNCVLKSRITYLGEDTKFEYCTFDTPKYALWIYGSGTYTFEHCYQNSSTARFFNIYQDDKYASPIIKVDNCKFVDSSDGKDSNPMFYIKEKVSATLTINNTIHIGTSALYGVKTQENGVVTSITVDGVKVYPTN